MRKFKYMAFAAIFGLAAGTGFLLTKPAAARDSGVSITIIHEHPGMWYRYVPGGKDHWYRGPAFKRHDHFDRRDAWHHSKRHHRFYHEHDRRDRHERRGWHKNRHGGDRHGRDRYNRGRHHDRDWNRQGRRHHR